MGLHGYSLLFNIQYCYYWYFNYYYYVKYLYIDHYLKKSKLYYAIYITHILLTFKLNNF